MRFRVSSVPPNFPNNLLCEMINPVEEVISEQLLLTLNYKPTWFAEGFNHKYDEAKMQYTRTVYIHHLEIEIDSMEEFEKVLDLNPLHRMSICPTCPPANNLDPHFTIDMGCY